VVSSSLAVGLPPISTVGSPVTMVSSGPAQVARPPTRAAGIPPINTVGQTSRIRSPDVLLWTGIDLEAGMRIADSGGWF